MNASATGLILRTPWEAQRVTSHWMILWSAKNDRMPTVTYVEHVSSLVGLILLRHED